MREINTFGELYNTSISIIENGNNTFADYSVIEIINHIRNNSDKELLNGFHILGNIPDYVAKEIQSKTTVIKFSVDSLIKNILEHPELTLNEY